ncbi:unnamed protein product [Haemonchus placei]|uniref:Uncharacterized protein n=1 Tax=Haemonchus placei TaxID=6290 RepID=A0A3P7UEQ9_HAEPC|nr:unnamed protein product [Haemonchus placei]
MLFFCAKIGARGETLRMRYTVRSCLQLYKGSRLIWLVLRIGEWT